MRDIQVHSEGAGYSQKVTAKPQTRATGKSRFLGHCIELPTALLLVLDNTIIKHDSWVCSDPRERRD